MAGIISMAHGLREVCSVSGMTRAIAVGNVTTVCKTLLVVEQSSTLAVVGLVPNMVSRRSWKRGHC